jgi:hypothetical protein
MFSCDIARAVSLEELPYSAVRERLLLPQAGGFEAGSRSPKIRMGSISEPV